MTGIGESECDALNFWPENVGSQSLSLRQFQPTKLDEITERESDQTVFEEMALLFDEIGASAANAAAVIRLAPLAAQETKGSGQSSIIPLAEMPA